MRWIGRTWRLLFQIEGSPSRVALAFGLGVFIAFFPILGIHTGMALVIAVVFRLSKVAILAGAWTNNPWTLAPMLTAGTLLGCALMGRSPASLGRVDWSLHGRAFYDSLLAGLGPLAVPFVVGNLVLGTLLGGLSYFALRHILERRRAAGRA